MSTPAPRRLPVQPGELIDRSSPVGFVWDRTPMTAFEGDSIVSAASANGKRIVVRSSSNAKARGFFSVDADDPHCLVTVDGERNVRAGQRQIAEGMRIESQTPWTSTTGGPSSGRRLPYALARLQDRFTRGSDHSFAPARFGRRTVGTDVLVVGGGPSGLSAAVAAAQEGARVHLVDHRHYLGGHLRWGDESDRRLAEELEAAVRANGTINVLLGAPVVGHYEDGWSAVSQRQVHGSDEFLTTFWAGSLVETADLQIARPQFDGAELSGVMSAQAVRMLINLYAVAPGDRAVVIGDTSEATGVCGDLDRVGIEVIEVGDRQVVSVSSARKALAVNLTDGSSIDSDLVVVGERWAHRKTHDRRDALLTGRGVVGPAALATDPHDALVAHGVATGRLAARRAEVRASEDQRPVTKPSELEGIGPVPGLPPSLGVLARTSDDPQHESSLQDWHQQHGAVQSLHGNRRCVDHYGDPQDEVLRARRGVGVHDIGSGGVVLLSGRDSQELLAALSDEWVDLAPGQLRAGLVRSEGGPAVRGTAGFLTNESLVLTAPHDAVRRLLAMGNEWIADRGSSSDASIDDLTAGYTGIRITGPEGPMLISRLSDGSVTDVSPGYLDRLWLAGAADCLLMRPLVGSDPYLEIYVPAGFGAHVWEQMFDVDDIDIAPVGHKADRILRLESKQFWLAPSTDVPWGASEVVELLTDDPSLVPTEYCRVVSGEGGRTVGRVLVAEFSPSLERSVCLGELAVKVSPGPLAVVNPDGERIAVQRRTGPESMVTSDV